MLLYRVTWVEPEWESLAPEEPFHPLFVPLDRQGGGRFDNPHRYVAMYASTTPEGAVGESLGNNATWYESEVTRPKDGRPRCLVTIEVPDETRIADLDDARVLIELGLRPSDVVRRNRDRTQEVALRCWHEMPSTSIRGLQWWSYWRPEWHVSVIWSDGLDAPWFPMVSVVEVEPMAFDLTAVVVAADVLPRELVPGGPP